MVLNIYYLMELIAIFLVIFLILWRYNKNAIKNNNELGKKLSAILLIAVSFSFLTVFIPVVYLGITDEIHITNENVYLKYLEVEQVSLKNKDLTIKNSDGYKIKINLEKNELDVYHNNKREDKVPTKRYFISKEQLEAIKNKEKYVKTSYLFYEDGSVDNVYIEIEKKEEDVENFNVSY